VQKPLLYDGSLASGFNDPGIAVAKVVSLHAEEPDTFVLPPHQQPEAVSSWSHSGLSGTAFALVLRQNSNIPQEGAIVTFREAGNLRP
jgi:hypothetical protein